MNERNEQQDARAGNGEEKQRIRSPRPQIKQEPPEDLFDLASIHLLWRRRWLVAFCVLLFLVLGLFQVRWTTPVYTSEAVLKYEPAAGQIVDFGERSRIVYSRDEIRTAVQLIRTPANARAVLASLDDGVIENVVVDDSPLSIIHRSMMNGLRRMRGALVSYPAPKVDQDRLDAQSAARSLLSTVSVSLRPDTRLIELRVSMSDAARAERVCDEFGRQFIRRLGEERRESFNYARDFLGQQITTLRQELEAAENALFEYGGQADMSLLQSDREIALSTLAQLNTDIEQLRNEIALLQAEADPKLAANMARQVLATERRGAIGPLTLRRDELLVSEAEMRAENSDDFLPLHRLRREIAALETQIGLSSQEFVDAYVASRAGSLEAANQRLAALESRLREHQEKVNGIELRMISFRVLQREIESTRDIYNALLDRFKRLEVTDQAAVGTVTIESPASIPTVPSAPNASRILFSFMSFGMLFGGALVLVLNKLDRSVKSSDLVEKTLGLPALAHIPCLRPKGGEARRLFGQRGSGARILAPFEPTRTLVGSEAFRYLRTSINYSSADAPCQVLLVTSCLPAEGKSTVASNLGIFFSEQGRSVLLLDGDLKKPTIHKAFSISRLPGLSDVLTAQAEFEKVIHQTGFPGFDVLAAGASTPSPVTLLESRAMAAFIEKMRTSYDVIIIDSSPADGMADALVLAKVADGVVLTVRQGHTPMVVLSRVTEKLLGMGVRILGVVYNSTEPAPHGVEYGQYYGKYTYGADAKA